MPSCSLNFDLDCGLAVCNFDVIGCDNIFHNHYASLTRTLTPLIF